MTIQYHYDLEQGSPEWFQARCGILTASEMDRIITPAKLQYSQSEKRRSHMHELLAQRINQYVEPTYIGEAMLRGYEDEITSRDLYSANYAPVTKVGFVTNDRWGFTLGASPDGLVGDDGAIECKSRCQKYQMQTILDDAMPAEFMLQTQTLLLVMERPWIDYVSFCGGMPLFVKCVLADSKVQNAIIGAAAQFEAEIGALHKIYEARIADPSFKRIDTERKKPLEMKEGTYE